MIEPYYRDAFVTIYHADARAVMPELCPDNDPYDAVVTDPVWPNAIAELAGSDDPTGLFTEVAAHFPRIAARAVIQLGCDSDVRFLAGMPKEMPFLRTCWLEYAQPGYKGRLLNTGDCAYAFGTWPASREGAHVIPGRYLDPQAGTRVPEHPAPRRLGHVQWLLRWFVEPRGFVLDPFMGSGTTLVAAKAHGMRGIGIEVEERYCELAVRRLAQGAFDFEEAS